MRSPNQITSLIIEAAMAVHDKLGPGLLESVYQEVLPMALRRRGLIVEAHRSVPFEFEGMHFQQGLIVDLLVEHQVIVELKSVEKLAPVHFRQLLTYLRLLDLRVGLLINFGGATIKEGLHRIVNNYVEVGSNGNPDGTEAGDTDKQHHEQNPGDGPDVPAAQA